jgi:hypothetical protein
LSAEPEPKPAPATTAPKRPRAASTATALLVGAAVALALLLLIAPPFVAVVGGVPCCLTGAAGCVVLGRLNLASPSGPEPWRLDAWALAVGGCSLLALGVSVGPEAKLLGWLLVALLVALALAGFGAGRAR